MSVGRNPDNGSLPCMIQKEVFKSLKSVLEIVLYI